MSKRGSSGDGGGGESVSSLDRLDSNLKLVNSRLKQFIAEDETKMSAYKGEIEQINERLSEIGEILYSDGTNKRNRTTRTKRSRRFAFIYLTIFFFLLAYYYYGYFEIYVIYLLRLIILGVSPVINLINIFSENCLIKNPFFVPQSTFTIETCQKSCDSTLFKKNFLKEFTLENSLNEKLFEKLVIDSNVPIIDNTTARTWELSSKSISHLIEMYRDSLEKSSDSADLLQADQLCYFDSSLVENGESVSVKAVFNRFLKKLKHKSTNEQIKLSWENCGRQSSKIARKLSKRAEFLGPNIEIARQNWYFISVNNPPPSKSSYLELPISFKIVLFCQIFGESKVKLIPVEECQNNCKKSDLILKQGQILILTNLWTLKFKPINEEDNLVMISLAHL